MSVRQGLIRESGALRDQTEIRSLQQAERAFLRADYSTAVSLLNRFLDTHPQSSRSLEARWWLARAYQKAGNLPSAVEHFRFLANTRTWNVYQADARSRVAQLEGRLGKSRANGSIKGLLVSLGSTRGDVDSVIPANTEIEDSMVLLDVPCHVDGNLQDNGQPFSFDALRSAIQHLHLRGIEVYLGVTPRCLGRVAGNRKLKNWQDGPTTRNRERYGAHPIIRCIMGATRRSSRIGSRNSVTFR